MSQNTLVEKRDGPFAYLTDEQVRQYRADRMRLEAAIDEALADAMTVVIFLALFALLVLKQLPRHREDSPAT